LNQTGGVRHALAYRGSQIVAEGFPLADVSDHLEHPEQMVWIDLVGPSATELAQLADELDIHELAVEDALKAKQRPKLDRYADHLFLSARAVHVLEPSKLAETEVAAFAGDRWLITISPDPAFSMDAVVARWQRFRSQERGTPLSILYCLLDVLIDGYFEALEAFDDYYDTVSEGIFAEHPLEPAQQRHWFQMRQALIRFHRLLGPTRELVSALMRREHDLPADLYPYFQDLYDHILRVAEATDALRDLVGTIVETNLSLRDYRQNQIMKKVTSWAAIVAVPTLITGYYGMNLPYPGAGEHWGVLVSGGLIASLSAALYVVFRRKDWL